MLPLTLDTTQSKPKSLDAITGLRFTAAMAVLIVHAIKFNDGKSSLGAIASNAVTFFFVLSGFILTYVYYQRLEKIGTFKFYVARFARIWPLHVVCFGAALVVMWCYRSQELVRHAGEIPFHLALFQSWLPADGLALRFNGPAWSISTEFAFYLVFPLLLTLVKKHKFFTLFAMGSLVVVGIAALEFAVYQGWMTLQSAITTAYVNPVIRVFDFMAGVVTAQLFLKRNWQVTESEFSPLRVLRDTVVEVLVVGLLIAVVYLVGFGEIRKFLAGKPFLELTRAWLGRGGAALVCFCAIIWVFSTSRGFLARLMSTKTMVYLGEISFALYLIQVPMFQVLVRETNWLQIPTLYFVILSTLICIALSMLLHAMVEAPFRRYLVDTAAGGWQGAFGTIGTGFKHLQAGHVGLTAGLILLLSFGLVRYEQYRSRSQVYVNPSELISVANSLAGVEYDRVTFKDEATLHWLYVTDQVDEVEITMWWQLLEGHKRFRFMHFCDEDGKVLSSSYHNARDFIGKPAGSFVLERCIVKKEDIKPGTKYIGVGFWASELGGAPADRGRRQMNERRLLVAELTPSGVVGINNASGVPKIASLPDPLLVVK